MNGLRSAGQHLADLRFQHYPPDESAHTAQELGGGQREPPPHGELVVSRLDQELTSRPGSAAAATETATMSNDTSAAPADSLQR